MAYVILQGAIRKLEERHRIELLTEVGRGMKVIAQERDRFSLEVREIGDEQEQAARTLGASSWQTFRRITLPAIRWAVIYGVILTTARCLGEYGAVAVVSGRLQGETETATLRVEERYQSLDLAGAYAISIVLALFAVLVLVALTLFRPKEEIA